MKVEYHVQEIEILLTVPKKACPDYDVAKKLITEEVQDPDFGDGLGYGLVKSYELQSVNPDYDDEKDWGFIITFTY